MGDPSAVPRVVSLLSSATEIVTALGCETLLVGRSHECDYPSSILALPQLTETKFHADGKSYEIDDRIRAILQEGLSVYRVRSERLCELSPNLILTQTQCEVCAVSERDVLQALWSVMGESKAQVLSLHTNTFADLFRDIHRIAKALAVEDAGAALVQSLESRIAWIRNRVHSHPKRVKLVCIEWISPLLSSGNWIPEMAEILGAEYPFGEAGKHSPRLDWQAVLHFNPDVITVFPCGFKVERTLEELSELRQLPGIFELSCVKQGRFFVGDGNAYFNRPGPRLVDSLEMLANWVRPDLFQFTHFEADSQARLDGGLHVV